ncbi:PRC-barrel domain-containing protein [uncultured Roseobacter sp.]|uniref:PRC-barrel domain-containing protein n=1 Tax=uncultured Roseobacter sp. TaxID=114847 RepID=UPI00261E49E3|nr:PRC-barrel domain-containing protein [uncultured Roseobacter sp.]
MTVSNHQYIRSSARIFLASAATALVLAVPAYADGHTSAFSDMEFDAEVNLNASELIGSRVYVSEMDMSDGMLPPENEREWDDIGEIHEIVLTRAGDVGSVIVDVGGFLGIGEREVAIDMSQLQFVSDGEDADEYFIVVNASVAGVEDAPEYRGADMETEADADMRDADERIRLTAPAVTRDGYEPAEIEQLTTEMLTGARVYSAADEDIGEVGELLLTDDGMIDRAVIDVGGFLGLGEHHVAVTMEELTILQSDGDLRVYIDATQEALEAQPEYEG